MGLSASVVVAQPADAETSDAAEPTEAIQVMVLGLYHFANPGADMVNSQVDDMLAPRRQQEIEALVESLADWGPTKIALEDEASAPTFELEGYARSEELLKTSPNETVQIGYRLGRRLGHKAVYGYDERSGEGEPDYFPMEKVQAFAVENGQMPILEKLIGEVQAYSSEQDAERETQSVAESLYAHNDGAQLSARHDRLYYSLIRIGDGESQPGAELNAYWYMRNAKMFGKIDMIAEPGDRVLVIAGSGHAPWLRHFAQRMPGFELVETMPYLERAAR
ncbi:MAG: DUF5694 domain-containing protein [Erythrobacter sp.]|uniref:DUF5694 domain-containing protein n=1 Tax=Erythrobacter sp. TaxID=1042 RepID=UPI00263A03A5|nr:DUF5694 domain-containing protein [Erythrobacter sp.]MDJ0978989.1 DUF5694 domain-containing protein [Erythrobacter sp.]